MSWETLMWMGKSIDFDNEPTKSITLVERKVQPYKDKIMLDMRYKVNKVFMKLEKEKHE